MASPQEKYTVDDGGALVSDLMQIAKKHSEKAPAGGSEYATSLRDIYSALENFEQRTGASLDAALEGEAVSRYSQLLHAFFEPAANKEDKTTPQQRADTFYDGVADIALDLIGNIDKPKEPREPAAAPVARPVERPAAAAKAASPAAADTARKTGNLAANMTDTFNNMAGTLPKTEIVGKADSLSPLDMLVS